jgi:hypothetical protein
VKKLTSQEAINFIKSKIQIDVRFCTDEDVKNTMTALNLACEALDLINSQKAEKETMQQYINCLRAEIERLRKETSQTIESIRKLARDTIRDTESEAIKEFAERLKKSPSVTNCESEWLYLDIDNLVKEMVGEKDV